jgi:hypothetical protein
MTAPQAVAQFFQQNPLPPAAYTIQGLQAGAGFPVMNSPYGQVIMAPSGQHIPYAGSGIPFGGTVTSDGIFHPGMSPQQAVNAQYTSPHGNLAGSIAAPMTYYG